MTQDSSTLPTHSHIDVSACAREAIRIPGAIQPHGFLSGDDISSAHLLVV
ncbi:MAG: fold, partial [Paucimonas sp.]|nr:fold [Paucimonas sp.]